MQAQTLGESFAFDLEYLRDQLHQARAATNGHDKMAERCEHLCDLIAMSERLRAKHD